MLLRRLLKIYLRNFVPLTRRLYQLLIRSKRTPALDIIEYEDGVRGTMYRSAIQVKCRTKNGILLSVNGNILPIVEDDVIVKLTVPVESGMDGLEVVLFGLFSSVRKTLPLNVIVTSAKTPVFERGLLVNEAQIRSVAHSVMTPTAAIKSFDNSYVQQHAFIKQVSYGTKNLEFNISTHHITELEYQLKEQTIHNE